MPPGNDIDAGVMPWSGRELYVGIRRMGDVADGLT